MSLAALAAIYLAVIAAGNTHAWSGSDPGGKVATIRWMAEHHSWKPDVGYWAARQDPLGDHHPLVYTRHVGDQWVQVTSLPFVYAGVPLWRVAGTAGILLLPVLGSLLAAYSAQRLARALGAPRGLIAFWVVGAATPMLFYAGDFWEHSMAVGLALLGLALVLEGGVARALAAGAAVGVAAVLRTEVLLYAAFLGLAFLFVAEERRAWLRQPARIIGLAAGLAVPLFVNGGLERAVLGSGLRDTRAGSNVAAAGAGLGTRLHDGALTAIGLFADDTRLAFGAGAFALLGLLLLARSVFRQREASLTSRAGAAVAGALYIARFFPLGLIRFVPGFFPAAPISAAGVTGPDTARERAIAAAAVVVLPGVWLLSWRGQLLPQWGGRYVLLSGALLTVVGAVALERTGWRRPAAALLVAFALVVSGLATVWHVQRTRGVNRAVASIERVPRDVVVVSRLAHLGREAGAWYGRHRWLNASGDGGTVEAAVIAAAAHATRIDVVDLDQGQRAQPLDGWRLFGRRRVPYLGFRLVVASYSRL